MLLERKVITFQKRLESKKLSRSTNVKMKVTTETKGDEPEAAKWKAFTGKIKQRIKQKFSMTGEHLQKRKKQVRNSSASAGLTVGAEKTEWCLQVQIPDFAWFFRKCSSSQINDKKVRVFQKSKSFFLDSVLKT